MQPSKITVWHNLSANTHSAIFMLLAQLGYVLNDTLMKLSSAEAGLFQVIFVRGLLLTTFIAFLVWRRGISLNPLAFPNPRVWLRALAEVLAAVFYLTALFNMPLANTVAILQVTPLLLALVAAIFLGEKVGWRRYTAIGAGLIGVLMIVRPGGEGFSAYALLALASVLAIIIRDLVTQRLPAQIPSLFVIYITSLLVTTTSGVVALAQGWEAMSFNTVGILFGAASFIFIGYIFSVMTMRVGEASFSAIFRYTVLVWGILLGIIVFNEIPDGWTLLGCGIVAGAGIYALQRERLR